MTLLEQIQNEAVDGMSDLATVLRRCLVLAARLKNQKFTEWVNHELNGYPEDAIPEHRILFGHCHGNFLGGGGGGVSNVPLLEGDIDPRVRDRLVRLKLSTGVTSLQVMLDHAREQGGCFRSEWPAEAIGLYQSSNVADHLQLGQAWTQVSDNMLAEVLSTIRTKVIKFVLEIMEANPDAGEAPIGFPAVPVEKTTQIYQNTITVHGNVGSLAGGSIGTQINIEMVRPGDLESLKAFLLRAGLPAADVAELDTAISREPEARSIEAGRETSGWWARIMKKITSGAITLGSTVSTELVKQGIDMFFQH